MTFPLPPPFSLGNWQVTQRVWASCVFPVLNSPNASVMAMDSIPPPRRLSNSGDPVVIFTMFFLFSTTSLPVIKTDFSIFLAASTILSTLASLIPLMLHSSLRVAMQTLATVHSPEALSLAMSAALMPCYCSLSISEKNTASGKSAYSYYYWRFCILNYGKANAWGV